MTEASSIVDHACSIPTHSILAFPHSNKPILRPEHVQLWPALKYPRFVMGQPVKRRTRSSAVLPTRVSATTIPMTAPLLLYTSRLCRPQRCRSSKGDIDNSHDNYLSIDSHITRVTRTTDLQSAKRLSTIAWLVALQALLCRGPWSFHCQFRYH